MKNYSLDVRSANYQCPKCGLPIDVVKKPRFVESGARRVDVEPCGHWWDLAGDWSTLG